ncbi:MAG: LacI family DNA-binding transcriptional regulator [Bacteroidia bacterium]|nr:LacI family DNA-binding transcriptional regulator [Bacteroidia bacterium]
MQKRQITLADLAKELGISTATVSRALKDYPDISVETKQKVIEMAEKLHYRPNTLAAGLRKRESKIIGVIIPDIVSHFFSSVINGIMDIAYQKGYRVMVCQSNESYEKEVADAQALLTSRVDGVLVSIAHQTNRFEHFQEFKDLGIPVVFFDKIPIGDRIEASKVVVDDFMGAYNTVEHLIRQGRKRIAHFRGPVIAYTSFNRYEGYKQALKDYNLPFDPALVFSCEDISFEEGQEFCRQVIALENPADAIFAVSDMVAMGAIVTARDSGLKIPADIAIAGFSDWKMASIVSPPLTSVAQPSHEMGRKAANLLLEEINANKNNIPFTFQTVVLKTDLRIRASTCIK